MVKTKIVATLGPASNNRTVLRKMILSGLDVVRLNFSHGTHQDKLKQISLIRELNKQYRRHIKILGDLEGYRIRIGELKEPLELKKGKRLYLVSKDILGSETRVPFDYQGDLGDIKKGQSIFIDDGNIELVVTGHKSSVLETRVIVAGLLKEHKGVNIPQARLKFAGLTAKDRQNIQFCIAQRFDYIAQSFVRTKEDILSVRKITGNRLPNCQLIAKIENQEGIRNLKSIIEVSQGIMIARGDLGVSLPIYQVPLIQKEIIRQCKLSKKFSITATQMLESMTGHNRPTRAEVSDVANAVIDGSEYLMLSAETAVGRYPVEAVQMMNAIIKSTENYLKQ